MPMNNSTSKNSSQSSGRSHHVEEEGLLHGNIKVVKKFLDKLPEHCEKVSNKTLKRVFDFARSYKVLNPKNSEPVEINLN